MPLPPPNTEWPPCEHGYIHDQLLVFDAWFTGDRELLVSAYGGWSGFGARPGFGASGTQSGFGGGWFGGDQSMPQDHPSQYRGGLVGRAARMFWGEPRHNGQRISKVHVPAAADIASTSAGLLFAEPPTITADDEGTQTRLDDLLDDRWWATVHDGAEVCAGLGGVFFRVGWDEEFTQRPIVTAIGPDLAVPVFRFGQLAEVTFTWQLSCTAVGVVIRHLENHTIGTVEHGLYRGTRTSLGQLIPVTEHPSTEILVDALDEMGQVSTGLDRLDVVYIPNLPSRRWRKHPIGCSLGQPDIAGVEPLLDSLDEAYTSWMRDIRLGKSRVIISQAWLNSYGPGKGASFDMDEELLVKVNIAPNQDAPLELIQPAIRFDEHAGTCTALLERIYTGAGYSLQTFGLAGAVAMTATESDSRDSKTGQTRGAKIRYWKPGLTELVETMLAVDAQVFHSGVTVAPPTVEFPPEAAESIEVLAQAAQLLLAAEAMSMENRVRLVQPSLDDDELNEEVQRIKDEQAAALAAAQPPLMADGTTNPADLGPPSSGDPNPATPSKGNAA